jgi:hypothetical protein
MVLIHIDAYSSNPCAEVMPTSCLCGHFHARPKAKGSNATKRLRKKRLKSLGMWAGKNKKLIIGSAFLLLNPPYNVLLEDHEWGARNCASYAGS